MSRRDDVLHAAVELLDEVGIDDLTTRRLAAKLGVQPGALYRHFASKQELLDAVVEHIVAGISEQEPSPDGWAESVCAIAGAARAGMLAHRDGARLVATMRVPGPGAVSGFEQLTGAIEAAGAGREHATLAADTIFAYVNGFTIEEQARKTTTIDRAERDRQFRAGLDLIVDGIRATLR